MKINELQLIRGGYVSNSSTEVIAQINSQPPALLFLYAFFIYLFFNIPCFNPWTLDIPLVLQSHRSVMVWLMSTAVSLFPLNGKAQLSKIDFPAQFTLDASR